MKDFKKYYNFLYKLHICTYFHLFYVVVVNKFLIPKTSSKHKDIHRNDMFQTKHYQR